MSTMMRNDLIADTMHFGAELLPVTCPPIVPKPCSCAEKVTPMQASLKWAEPHLSMLDW